MPVGREKHDNILERRTIQSTQISTISSLIDENTSNANNLQCHENQRSNYGLYALKYNRTVAKRTGILMNMNLSTNEYYAQHFHNDSNEHMRNLSSNQLEMKHEQFEPCQAEDHENNSLTHVTDNREYYKIEFSEEHGLRRSRNSKQSYHQKQKDEFCRSHINVHSKKVQNQRAINDHNNNSSHPEHSQTKRTAPVPPMRNVHAARASSPIHSHKLPHQNRRSVQPELDHNLRQPAKIFSRTMESQARRELSHSPEDKSISPSAEKAQSKSDSFEVSNRDLFHSGDSAHVFDDFDEIFSAPTMCTIGDDNKNNNAVDYHNDDEFDYGEELSLPQNNSSPNKTYRVNIVDEENAHSCFASVMEVIVAQAQIVTSNANNDKANRQYGRNRNKTITNVQSNCKYPPKRYLTTEITV